MRYKRKEKTIGYGKTEQIQKEENLMKEVDKRVVDEKEKIHWKQVGEE